MKLSKPNEDTLKGIAKFLKLVSTHENDVLSDTAKALEKDLRQFRASIKDMPEPGTLETTGGGTGEPLPEVEQLEANPITPRLEPGVFEPAVFVNPVQLEANSNLIAIRQASEGLFTELLYRKKS